MEPIQAIYASASGNVEFTVETVATEWQNHGYQTQMHRSEMVNPEIIDQNRFFLFAASTWDRGSLNPFFDPILEKIAQTDCSGKSAFFIGCGDFRYESVFFNSGIQKVHDVWKEKGGQALFRHLKINGDPQLSIDNLIKPWIMDSLPILEQLKKEQGG